MNNIPPKLKEEMSQDPYYKKCARNEALSDHTCEPDPLTQKLIEWEHTLYFQGKQLQKKFCIIPICWLVHRGGKLNKEINVWIALNRATPEELIEISKATDYIHMRKYLNTKYGIPELQGGV